ncbi:MAG: hypothetical protein ACPGPS_15410 [Rubripirellula sp.]
MSSNDLIRGWESGFGLSAKERKDWLNVMPGAPERDASGPEGDHSART